MAQILKLSTKIYSKIGDKYCYLFYSHTWYIAFCKTSGLPQDKFCKNNSCLSKNKIGSRD